VPIADRIHDLRHTFASLLLQQGESIVYVKEQLGHPSIQITVDTYGHLIPGANRAAVDKLDEPNFRELEPTSPMAQAGRGTATRRLSREPLRRPNSVTAEHAP
jgi:hypothetical protein